MCFISSTWPVMIWERSVLHVKDFTNRVFLTWWGNLCMYSPLRYLNYPALLVTLFSFPLLPLTHFEKTVEKFNLLFTTYFTDNLNHFWNKIYKCRREILIFYMYLEVSIERNIMKPFILYKSRFWFMNICMGVFNQMAFTENFMKQEHLYALVEFSF